MTRYTKLGRKKHVKADDQFTVTPLAPKKQQEGNDKPGNNSRAPNDRRPKRKHNSGDFERSDKDAEKRKKRRQMKKEKSTVCFGCRQKGHSVSECPEAKTSAKGICYNCGSTEHSLSKCRKPRKNNELPYAKCFICKKNGHLSGQCPENPHGLYPNGGGCRFCGQVDHLAKDCKITKEEAGTTAVGKIDLDQGADDDDYHIFVSEKQKLDDQTKVEKKEAQAPPKPKKKIVKF
ncbi:hypothetical protein K492DRAFT_205672 [Lichtheimia hyalospora FSU 10163]|nr:hypothetical protein K492DRAFT_205672 [Lichtheimia hyalospora FSU 10163]